MYIAFLIWPLKHFKVAQCHLFWRAVTFSLYIFNSYIYNVYFLSNPISIACGVYSVYFIFWLQSNWISLLLFIPKLDACFCSLRFSNKGYQLFHIKMESHIVKQFYKVIKATNSIQCKCYINNTASLRLWMNCIPSCWP